MGPGRTQPVSTTPSCPVVLGLSQASLESGAVRLAPLNQQGGRAGGGGGVRGGRKRRRLGVSRNNSALPTAREVFHTPQR